MIGRGIGDRTELPEASKPECAGLPISQVPILHHFPTTACSKTRKCRQLSVFGSTRESLGSFYTAIVRRPLVVSDCTQKLILRIEVTNFHCPVRSHDLPEFLSRVR